MMSTDCSVKLACLRAADAKAVEITTRCLQKDGFVFLEFTDDDELSKQAIPIVRAAAEFLQGPGRGSGYRDALTGHISSAHKDSISVLSGNQFTDAPLAEIQTLVRLMDDSSKAIVEVLAQPLFGCSDTVEVGKTFDLPLLDTDLEHSYGMVDIACYHNEPGAPDVIVSEHQDPGLLILSLPQLSAGLELRDATNKWVVPPKGMGVLWAGAKATETGIVQPGIHRVRAMIGTPRVSCWHEICTSSQIAPPMLEKLAEDQEELELGTIKGTRQVLETLRRAEDHDPSSTEFLKISEVASGGGVPLFKFEHAVVRVPVRVPKGMKRRFVGLKSFKFW